MSRFWHAVPLLSICLPNLSAAFHLYLPSLNKEALVAAYGVTEACFDAMYVPLGWT
jgi:hypothetical protein